MRGSRWRSWGGAVVLAVVAGACGGGGEADHENESEGRDVVGPSATVSNPAPTATPTPAPAPAGDPSPAATPVPAAPAGGTAAAAVAWEPDIRPILATDCVHCHGYLASYAGTMSVVTPGDGNSALVGVTKQGGAMYSHLSGDRAAKAALIRAWVVDNGAAASR